MNALSSRGHATLSPLARTRARDSSAARAPLACGGPGRAAASQRATRARRRTGAATPPLPAPPATGGARCAGRAPARWGRTRARETPGAWTWTRVPRPRVRASSCAPTWMRGATTNPPRLSHWLASSAPRRELLKRATSAGAPPGTCRAAWGASRASSASKPPWRWGGSLFPTPTPSLSAPPRRRAGRAALWARAAGCLPGRCGRTLARSSQWTR
mmetsp:Transcript_57487/g.182082  ORF Transcript_57487/g.182082 Transcript_57487/m.182082 type:complete len:215 (-) Transcript_57487:87-731(-)